MCGTTPMGLEEEKEADNQFNIIFSRYLEIDRTTRCSLVILLPYSFNLYLLISVFETWPSSNTAFEGISQLYRP